MSSVNLEQFLNETGKEKFVEREPSSFMEVARALLAALGMMLLLGIGTYLVVFVLSAVLAALLF
jgi:hypothetical protein